jgi:hypothetical protein
VPGALSAGSAAIRLTAAGLARGTAGIRLPITRFVCKVKADRVLLLPGRRRGGAVGELSDHPYGILKVLRVDGHDGSFPRQRLYADGNGRDTNLRPTGH